MKAPEARLRPARRMATIEIADPGTPAHECRMLLDLAADLQRWPARNVVFREALDRAAQDLARLASEPANG